MNKTLLGFGALAVVLGIVGFAASTFAYRGDPSIQGLNYSAERHEAMEKAFESRDYNAWKELMQGRGHVSRVINQDNFAKFAEAHELAEQGKLDEAQKIRGELGLGIHNCNGERRGFGRSINQ